MCGTILAMTRKELVKASRALGDPIRLQILEFLTTCQRSVEIDETGGVIGPTAGEVCCHITGTPKVSSTISKHLHLLEAAGLIAMEKRGKTVVCQLNRDGLGELAQSIRLLAQAVTHECC
jgi:DNA-binding transcriptional ArsR family regulator